MGIIQPLLEKLPWESGRQMTGYLKIKLFQSKLLKFDGYLLYYPTGSEIPAHVDKVNSGKHYRLNIMLKKAKLGGEFKCKDPIFRLGRVFYFRPDVSEHYVTKIKKGYRLMLSFGWIR